MDNRAKVDQVLFVLAGGGRVVRWSWVNFSAGASYNFDYSRQGPIALAVGAGGGGLDIFTHIYPSSSFCLSLGDGSI